MRAQSRESFAPNKTPALRVARAHPSQDKKRLAEDDH
jgi:hypothetical protein